jgi:hypothetical protein
LLPISILEQKRRQEITPPAFSNERHAARRMMPRFKRLSDQTPAP